MLDPKLLLARCLTLLYRESLLKNSTDNSIELVRTVLKDVQVVEHSIGLNEDKHIIVSLKATILDMCDTFKDEFELQDLVQRVRLNCEGDDKLFDALKTSLEIDYSESSLKKSVIAIRKQLDSHFREKEIAEAFRKASADITYNREKIADLSNYVAEFVTKIEPLTMVTKTNDPAVIQSLDFGDVEEIRKVFQSMNEEDGQGRVYKTGFKGLNEMTQGGLRGSQTTMRLGLPHKYKTGLGLSLFSQVLRYNKPKTKDKNKIPCMVRISFEDEMPNIVNFLFMQMKYTETRQYVDIKNFTPEEMSTYVMENLQRNGWRVFMLRVDPTGWTYKDVFNYITTLESMGYSVEGLWLDYMGLIPTTGCIQGQAGEALRDMLRRFRNFCSAKGILFETPHQLSTEAKALLRGVTTDSMFVKDIAEKGYAAGSKQLDQELDLEIYHHIFKVGKQAYLAVQRGKHRISTLIEDFMKFFILEFPTNLMPIPDDIHDDGPVMRRVGATNQSNKDDQELYTLK